MHSNEKYLINQYEQKRQKEKQRMRKRNIFVKAYNNYPKDLGYTRIIVLIQANLRKSSYQVIEGNSSIDYKQMVKNIIINAFFAYKESQGRLEKMSLIEVDRYAWNDSSQHNYASKCYSNGQLKKLSPKDRNWLNKYLQNIGMQGIG